MRITLNVPRTSVALEFPIHDYFLIIRMDINSDWKSASDSDSSPDREINTISDR